jgi:hypothetical protein
MPYKCAGGIGAANIHMSACGSSAVTANNISGGKKSVKIVCVVVDRVTVSECTSSVRSCQTPHWCNRSANATGVVKNRSTYGRNVNSNESSLQQQQQQQSSVVSRHDVVHTMTMTMLTETEMAIDLPKLTPKYFHCISSTLGAASTIHLSTWALDRG